MADGETSSRSSSLSLDQFDLECYFFSFFNPLSSAHRIVDTCLLMPGFYFYLHLISVDRGLCLDLWFGKSSFPLARRC